MNIVMIIPTGIGCEIGGHAGDATPAARLLGACCDKIILHPNVVNASDINEMPENALYVEGSILDRFLEGDVQLEEVKSNNILVAVNKPIANHTINAVSAARTTLGLDANILVLEKPLEMMAKFDERGKATGEINGWKELCEQVGKHKFDALAIATKITITDEVMIEYFNKGRVNPIGGVEAKASRLIADKLKKPVAHAPFEEMNNNLWKYNEIVDPRLAAEMVSTCFLHCVLKGLHKSPRIGKGISVKDVDCLVTPVGCWGRPHQACYKQGIPIIAVKENVPLVVDAKPLPSYDAMIYVENYLEAAGLLIAMHTGILPESVRRPLEPTSIINS